MEAEAEMVGGGVALGEDGWGIGNDWEEGMELEEEPGKTEDSEPLQVTKEEEEEESKDAPVEV